MGDKGYTAVQLMQIIGEKGIRIIPELAVNGGGEKGSGGIVEALLAVILQNQLAQPKPANGNGTQTQTAPQAKPQPRPATATQTQKPVVERVTPIIPPTLPE
jgi:hypothetical protein